MYPVTFQKVKAHNDKGDKCFIADLSDHSDNRHNLAVRVDQVDNGGPVVYEACQYHGQQIPCLED